MKIKLTGLPGILLVLPLFLNCFCLSPRPATKVVTVKTWLNWNLVFQTRTDSRQRDAIVRKIKAELQTVTNEAPNDQKDTTNPFRDQLYAYLRNTVPNGKRFAIVNAQEYYCSCNDSLLWNLQADLLIDSSGGSVPNPPKPKSNARVQGDFIEDLAANEEVAKPATGESGIDFSSSLKYPESFSFIERGFISVIDTGIDSVLIGRDVWNGILPYSPSGSMNVLRGATPGNFYDDNSVKHGTSVASLVLNSAYNSDGNRRLPRLMILKAMDKTGKGDLFALCCAIGHSVRNGAKLINISAGYYGEPNDVLNAYLHLSKQNRIPVVVAAGNYAGVRGTIDICSNSINADCLLSAPGNLFYPACMSNDSKKYGIISVTGMSATGKACYFQNYSDEFVMVGVVNKKFESKCCSYTLPFIKNASIEGTSFAAPVVSGRLGAELLKGSSAVSTDDYLQLMGASPLPAMIGPGANVVKNFISY